jgi:hypothetical protein
MAYQSGSNELFLPVQDVFGWTDRVNVPATIGDHNWTWKLPWHVDKLRHACRAGTSPPLPPTSPGDREGEPAKAAVARCADQLRCLVVEGPGPVQCLDGRWGIFERLRQLCC